MSGTSDQVLEKTPNPNALRDLRSELKAVEKETTDRSKDIYGDILEEIALEGLDGITLQALWERLKRRPGFSISICEESRVFIWRCVKRSAGLKIFLLPTPRPDLVIHERFDYRDERGNVFEPLSAPEDIYVYFPIDDKKTRTRGSCAAIYARIDVTSKIRKYSYEMLHKRYGNRIVLVASQEHRESVILPSDIESNVELTTVQYCMIERIARSRYLGESTRGNVSLATMKVDPKSLFYQRKLLLKRKIITKQPFSMKFGASQITSLVSILHIPRFFTPVETLQNKIIRTLFEHLRAMPSFRDETARLKPMFGKHIIRAILSSEHSGLFYQTDAPYSDFHQKEIDKEKNPIRVTSLRQKTVKVIVLKEPGLNIGHYFCDKAEEKDDTESDTVEPEKSIFVARNISLYCTMNCRAHIHVINSGAGGATLREIGELENVSNLDARSACRVMTKIKSASIVYEDMKKTKVQRFVWFKYKKANLIYQKFGPQVGDKNKPLFIPTRFNLPRPSMSFWNISDASIGPERLSLEPKPAQPEVNSTIRQELPVPEISSPTTGSTNTGELAKETVHSDDTTVPSVSSSFVENSSESDSSETKKQDDSEAKKQGDDSEAKKQDDSEMKIQGDDVDPNYIHFAKGEENDFVPIEGNEDKHISYETAGGWQVFVQPADVNIATSHTQKINSMKNFERTNYVLELVNKNTLVVGFQQILRAVRRRENNTAEDTVDRRSIFRILKQLKSDGKIQIWRIIVSNGGKYRMCAAFTPGIIRENSELLATAVDSLINCTIRREKSTSNQKKKNQKQVSRLKKTVVPPPVPPPVLSPPLIESATLKTVKHKPKRKKAPSFHTKLARVLPTASKPSTPQSSSVTAAKKQCLYDEVDKLALSRMKGQRGDWTEKEDRYALCLFIASVLFIPNYNYDKVFIFNAAQIRDIMHEKLEESRSKTSVSVRRRIHFLMKAKNFYARYRYYLNSAFDDTELQKEIQSHWKPKQRKSKMFCDIPSEVLIKVFEYLMNLFTNSSSAFFLKKSGGAYYGSSASHEGDVIPLGIKWKFLSKKARRMLIKTGGLKCETISGPRLDRPKKRIVVVDCNHDPRDARSVDIWNARTALLSMILGGDVISAGSTSFLDSVTDGVLDHVVTYLKSSSVTTIGKPDNRFVLSAVTKRKLHIHIPIPVFRQCYDILKRLRGGATFVCSRKLCIPALFLLADFTKRRSLKFEFEMPESIATVNDEWKDLFENVTLKDFETPSKTRRRKSEDIPELADHELDHTVAIRGGTKKTTGSEILPKGKRKRSAKGGAGKRKNKNLTLQHDSDLHSISVQDQSALPGSQTTQLQRKTRLEQSGVQIESDTNDQSAPSVVDSELPCVISAPDHAQSESLIVHTKPPTVSLDSPDIQLKTPYAPDSNSLVESAIQVSPQTVQPKTPVLAHQVERSGTFEAPIASMNSGNSLRESLCGVTTSPLVKQLQFSQQNTDTFEKKILYFNEIYKQRSTKANDDEQDDTSPILNPLVISSDIGSSLAAACNTDVEDNDRVVKDLDGVSSDEAEDEPIDPNEKNVFAQKSKPLELREKVVDSDTSSNIVKSANAQAQQEKETTSAGVDSRKDPDYNEMADHQSDSDEEYCAPRKKPKLKTKEIPAVIPESLRLAFVKLSKVPTRKEMRQHAAALQKKKMEQDGDIFPGPIFNRPVVENKADIIKDGRISNKMLRTLRAKINATLAEDKLIDKDFFSVNLTKISATYKFPPDVNRVLYNKTLRRPTSVDLYLQNHLVRSVPVEFCDCDSSIDSSENSGIGKYAELYEIIELGEECGISIPYLLTKFEREYASQGLLELLNLNYIYMVGIQFRRLVSTRYVKNWTMPVPSDQGMMSSKRIIMRPWVTSKGLVNWDFVVQIFSTLIGALSTHISISVKYLCKSLAPFLSAVEIMILVEALDHLEIVRIYKLDVSHETTIFSGTPKIIRTCDFNLLLEFEELYVELRAFSTAKFADMLDLITPSTISPDIPLLDITDD